MANCRTPEQELSAREELLAACTRVFVTEGFEQATMKRLAEEAHCSTGRFYSNFSGKYDILRFLWGKLCPMAQAAVRPLLGESESPALSGLLLCGLVLEAGGLNAPLRELLCCGLSHPDIVQDTVSFAQPILQGKAAGGQKACEEEQRYRTVLALGMLHSQLLWQPGFRDNAFWEESWFYEGLLRLYRTPEADIRALLEAVAERKAAVREAAYQWLIQILGCRFDSV